MVKPEEDMENEQQQQQQSAGEEEAVANSNQPRPADSKREEFRKYLEKSGVLDSLTKVLVTLYEEPEKPSSAVDFLKQHIGGGPPESANVETLKNEVKRLTEKNKELEDEVSELKQKLEQYEANKAEEEKSS